MDTYTAMMDAKREMEDADRAFQSALEKQYGVTAGDVRYSPGDQTASVRALGDKYKAKAQAWREASQAHRDASYISEKGAGFTHRHKCCDCGTELVSSPKDPPTKLSLCSGCWSRLSSSVIVERSRKHDTQAHAECRAHRETQR